jgi:prepilin-type N-terminal cleavage/methylation domain-containing protein
MKKMRGFSLEFSLGFSLVELMVSLSIGLVLVTLASTAGLAQWRQVQGLVKQTHLTQALRSTLYLVGNNLRRTGYFAEATQQLPWPQGLAGPAHLNSNPYALSVNNAQGVEFGFSRKLGEPTPTALAYRLHQGALQMQLKSSPWQTMTDKNLIEVDQFSVVTTPYFFNGSMGCLNAVLVSIDLKAHLTQDPKVTSDLKTSVLLRHQALAGC